MDDPGDIRRRVRAALAEQRRTVRALLVARAQLTGSLITRYGRCGKPGCACGRGAGHGPYYVLSRRSGGKGAYEYLDAPRARAARGLVGRARAFRHGLRRLQRLNLELLVLLRRYQDAMSRRGGRRVGLTADAS
ncbi:MAG TPA: DUF6788 family protein [Vicinamibacteria bacterium]|jgi:hypothetical protein